MRPLRTFAAVSALACVAVAVAWWVGRPIATGSLSAVSPAARLVDAAAAVETHEALAPSAAEDRRELAEQGGACRLFGEVVDEQGQPLAGVAVRLDVREPALVRETRTGADGRYELNTPLPNEGPSVLSFSAGPLLSAVERRLWRNGSKTALRAGDNDLGRTVLERACAIEGRVTLRGAPVPYLELAAVQKQNFVRAKVRTAEDGSFRFESLALGKYDIESSFAANSGTSVLAAVDVASSEARKSDLLFPWASFVSGRAVDARGAPCANAVVVAQLANDERAPLSRNSADEHGRFCVPLSTIEPHRLQASAPARRPEFALAPTTVFAPGEASVVLVASEVPRARFRVVDADSHAPIEEFGLRLARPAPSDGHGIPTKWIRSDEHPGGECEAEVEADRCLVQVSAQGYEPRELRLDCDPPLDGVQVIELSRAAVVVGRLTMAGKDAPNCMTRLDALPAADETPSTFVSAAPTDLSDVHGAFRIDSVLAGDYQLTVHGESGARGLVRELRVERGAVLDLGEIELAAGAALRVTAMLPPRVDPKRVRVLATSGRIARGSKLDAQGRTEFAALPAGACVLSAPEVNGAIVGGAELPLELVAGAEHDVVFDLRGYEGMWLVVHVSAGDEPVVRARVEAVPDLGLAAHGALGEVGYTSAVGDARMWIARSGRVALTLESAAELRLGRFESNVAFDARGEGRVDLELELGRLAVDWRSLALGAEVELVSIDIDVAEDALALTRAERSLRNSGFGVDADSTREAFERQRIEFTTVGAGSHDVRLIARTSAGSITGTYVREVTVRGGETAVCALTSADQVE